MRRFCFICVFVIAHITTATAMAQSFGASPPPAESDAKWSVGSGLSYGTMFKRDAQFWGVTLNVSRPISKKWGVSTAVAFDQESEKMQNGDHSKVNSFTAIVTPYYRIVDRLTLSGGFGKGVADDDNTADAMRFTNGDWSTGAALSVSIYSRERVNVGFDTSLEYNISKSEWSISWDLGFSYAF